MSAPRGVFTDNRGVVGSFTSWFECTGEFRQPQPGEFYLSGAIPAVYQMPEPLPESGLITAERKWKTEGTPFWIMRKVPDPPVEVTVGRFKYRLVGSANREE